MTDKERGYTQTEEYKKRNREKSRKYYAENTEMEKERHKIYQERNKEKLAEKAKKYYAENKEKIAKYNKEHREENRDEMNKKGRERYKKNKGKESERSKKYYVENREKVNEKNRANYKKNREEILEKQKVTVKCECGSVVRKKGLNRHKTSEKHKRLTTRLSFFSHEKRKDVDHSGLQNVTHRPQRRESLCVGNCGELGKGFEWGGKANKGSFNKRRRGVEGVRQGVTGRVGRGEGDDGHIHN